VSEGVFNSPIQAIAAEESKKDLGKGWYEDIIFLTGYRAENAIKVFNRETGGGCEGVLQFLDHYHVPGRHEIGTKTYGNKHADKYEIGGYLLTIDKWVPSVGLQYEVTGGKLDS